jgi:hypothetical protein
MQQKSTFQMSFHFSERSAMSKPGAFSHTFYEFFAGSGMVRAGLGDSWRCLFANDLDEKKAVSYEQNWGNSEVLVRDVGKVASFELPAREPFGR